MSPWWPRTQAKLTSHEIKTSLRREVSTICSLFLFNSVMWTERINEWTYGSPAGDNKMEHFKTIQDFVLNQHAIMRKV